MKKLQQVQTNDIIYCKADGCYTQLVLTDNRIITISKTLKRVEEALVLINSCFIRINDSYLINMKQIKNLYAENNSIVEMNNNEKVEIAVRRKRWVLLRLLKVY